MLPQSQFVRVQELDTDHSFLICEGLPEPEGASPILGLPVWLANKRVGKIVGVGRHSGTAVQLDSPEAVEMLSHGVISGLAIEKEFCRLVDFARPYLAKQDTFDIRAGGTLRKQAFVNHRDRDMWGFNLAKTATHGQHRNRLRSICHSL